MLKHAKHQTNKKERKMEEQTITANKGKKKIQNLKYLVDVRKKRFKKSNVTCINSFLKNHYKITRLFGSSSV